MVAPSKLLASFATRCPVLPLIAKANGVNEENIERSRTIVAEYLTELEGALAETGYLVGDSFTAADLTAAALLVPIANPGHPDTKRPEPIMPAFQKLLDDYSDHPVIKWVENTYRQYRD